MTSKPEKLLTSTRIAWVDNLRTIGIFSIVLVHTGRLDDGLDLYAASFFMPLFFFISGLFVKESIRQQTLIAFVKARSQRLLIPYFTFSFISYILWFFLLGRIKGDPLPSNPILHFLTHLIYGVGGYGWLDYNITLWFFPCLFVTEIIFFLLLICLPYRQHLGFTLFCLSIIGYFFFQVVDIEKFRLPFGIDIALTAVVFYGIGYLVQPFFINDNFKGWYRWPLVFLGMLAYIVFSNFNQKSAFIIGNFGKNYFSFYLAALAGILFWSQIARLIKPNIVFSEIGKNTLVIFPSHLLLFPFFTGILVYAFRIPKASIEHSNLVALAYTIIAICILVPFAWFLNYYLPFLLGRKPHRNASI
jgi:fucose 4-O-acetylase-like acetyltransferase